MGLLILLLTACAPASTQTPSSIPLTEEFIQPETPPTEALTFTPLPPTETFTPLPPTETFTPIPPTETSTPTETPTPAVESLQAQVTADLLSCRYGPGPEYLYLFAFRKTTKIRLLGKTAGASNWVLVQNSPQKCWVNAKFLDISGDPQSLPVMYPDGYKLPVSPYYSSPSAYSGERDPNNPDMVTLYWSEMTLRAGDEEDENMFIYIIEVWRCEGGQIIFDPLASNYPEVSFIDEAGCSSPSHGRVFFQEKHGYAGPSEFVWPER
jgi:hypothetical protein